MNEKKLLELLAYASYESVQLVPDGAVLPDTDEIHAKWREFEGTRHHYRSVAANLLRSLRNSGVSVKISKEKVADDALLEIITIPPRAAYALPCEPEEPSADDTEQTIEP